MPFEQTAFASTAPRDRSMRLRCVRKEALRYICFKGRDDAAKSSRRGDDLLRGKWTDARSGDVLGPGDLSAHTMTASN